MSSPRYPTYRDSGLEWLGAVPAHWQVLPIKRLGRLKSGAGFPHAEQGVSGEELPFYKVGDLGRATPDDALSPSEHSVSRETAARLGAFVFPPRSIVFAKVGAALMLGRIRLLGNAACLDNNMMGLVADQSQISVGYLKYAMSLVRFDLIANPGAVPSLNEGQIGEFRLPVPTREEQCLITRVLERELGKVDALIAEQRRLIELLQEKRQAAISHAVTKGLSPGAPMKASGIKWLGDVPAHWEIAPLRRFDCLVQTGPFGSQLHAEEYVTGAVPVINPVNLVGGRIVPSEEITVPEKVVERLAHQMLVIGDIVFSRRGELGRCALVTPESAGWLCGTGCMIVRLRHLDYRSDYLSHLLSLDLLREYFESFSVGAIMDNLSASTVLAMPLLVPPAVEQAQIAEHIKRETGRIDELIGEATRAVVLLRERRSALISAAVTGKIDVRGHADMDAEAA